MNFEGNILVLTQWSFRDALVQTYTLPYVQIIRKVVPHTRKIIILTSEQKPIDLKEDEINRINNEWQQNNMQLIAERYQRFGLRKLKKAAGNIYRLYRLIRKEKIGTVHAFCTPAGGIAYLLCKFTGAKLIIDSYEPHAEAMVENGTWKKDSMAYKILFTLEKKQTQQAKALIGTTAGMKQYAMDRYETPVENFLVKPACVDLKKFFPSEKDDSLVKELGFENKIVCVYAGKLGGIYLKDEVFNFAKSCYDRWKDNFRFLMLTNASKEAIDEQINRVGLPGNVVVGKFIYHNDVPRYLSLGNFAINPVKPVPTKKYCTSIKDGEYWAMGLPVVISPNISDDSSIIQKEDIGVVMDFTNKEQYLQAIEKLENLMQQKKELTARIRAIGEKHRSYTIAENIYKAIYG